MEHNIARMDFHSWLWSLDDAVGFRCPNPTDASAKNTRLESYGKLCVLGLIVMCFGRTADVLKVIHETNKHHGYYCVIYFNFLVVNHVDGISHSCIFEVSTTAYVCCCSGSMASNGFGFFGCFFALGFS